MGIVTKRGDGGTTKLLSGKTVSKADVLLDVVGTLDELSAVLGLARSFATDKGFSLEIREMQTEIMRLASEFSLGNPNRTDLASPTTPAHISKIEAKISKLESTITLPKAFIVSGSTPCSSAIEIARAIARRLEREAVAISEAKVYESAAAFIYINRLSDYLFLLARRAEILAGVPFDSLA